MALSLLQDWCRELNADVHRALLVTGIPEGLEQADIEAVLQPTFLPLGTFRLRNVRAMRNEKAKAALVEFVDDISHAALVIPRQIPGKDGVWRVLWKERAQDTRVLRQMKRLLLDERPARAAVARAPGDTRTTPALETQAQGSGQAARKAGPASGAARNARRGRRGRRNRARGSRVTEKGRKRGRGGRPCTAAESESGDSSDGSLGFVIREIDQGDLSADEDQSALYATLQAAAKELVKKWAPRSAAAEEHGPREFLALVTVTDRAKKEEMEEETPGAESIRLSIRQDRSGVPDLVALLAVRATSAEEPMDSDASESDSQDDEEQEKEGMDNPEFVAIVAYTDPSDPSAREEMLKIASVIESLGWGDKRDKKDVLPQVLSVMSKDTSGTRVKVEEAGREVDAVVLRKARDDGDLLECLSALAEPELPCEGRKAERGLLGGWGKDGEDEGGLLELVALLAARDAAEGTTEEERNAWEGGEYRHAEGGLGQVLALLAAREESEAASDAEWRAASEDAESEESQPEDAASRKPRAKRARTAPRGPAQAAAPARPRARAPRGGGRGVTPEKTAGSRAPAEDDAAGGKKKQRSAGAGARARAGEAKGQPAAGCKSARAGKARRGGRLPPRCR
ncbi:paraneoplastic antigen-like protein 8B [Daubentonia madagascariensis]|uniref:Paraneoplastic antigen-like protein 8B n=1 Tax=Daubentonia madagascariensis TaxID=31869 RepID=A0ABD2D8B1_DAUMA